MNKRTIILRNTFVIISFVLAGLSTHAWAECDRYLLLDSRIIESTDNAKLVIGAVRKDKNNPLFKEDKSWEKRFDNLYANVIYDEAEGIYKCWYSPFIVDKSALGMTLEERKQKSYRAPRNREMAICYAISKDGIAWVKPELGIVEYEGNKATNILWRGSGDRGSLWEGPHGSGIFKDLRDTDPKRRYKAFLKAKILSVAFSADGIHWGPAIACPEADSAGDTHNNAFWAPTLGKYVGITREWGDAFGRQVARTLSADFVNWSKSEVVLEGLDKGHQTYAMPVFYHGGIYLGLVAIHDQEADRVWTELTWSPDTITWHRVLPGTPLIPNSEKEGEYDWGCVYAAACPIFLEDEIRLYYGGSDGKHTSWRNGFFCLATLRPDGWAGYEPIDSDQSAVIKTIPVVCTGKDLQLCADVEENGYVKINLFDSYNKLLAEGELITKTVTDSPIRWKDGFSFKKLKGKEIRLRFELRESKLYSFSFEFLESEEQPSNHGFVSIFDGKTIEGWHAAPIESASDWTVRNGVIVGHGSADRLSYLVWKDDHLSDFELKLRYRLPGKGNTGVEIRSQPDLTGKRPFEGYHADLGYVGIGPHILGAWDFHFATRKEYPCQRGTRLVIDEDGKPYNSTIKGSFTAADVRQHQWNDVHIIARGNHFEFFINGKLASEFTDNAKRGRLDKGAIGLQIHDKGMQVEFKDIRLKRTEELKLEVEQITHGPRHHFFGYIGQSLTIPWNQSGRYILSLRTDFHDHMPQPHEAADIVLIDTLDKYRVIAIEKTLAWNFQQGTMFYWNPTNAESQFFFNDRDPRTQQVFTVLYDLKQRRRIREYRFNDVPVANGGVSPTGDFFLAINYGRMARLRPVTGYPDLADPTAQVAAPNNDGIFLVEIATGRRKLLVSFRQLRDLLWDKHERINEVDFYINHSLCNRSGDLVYFFARARFGDDSMAVNAPCSIRTDGTNLMTHEYIGGHPEWDEGSVIIGAKGKRQVRYDIEKQSIIGQIGTDKDFVSPGGDISLSPDAKWFTNGFSTNNRKQNEYILLRRSDGASVRSKAFSRGPYQRGELRIDPAPRWNRWGNTILVPGITADGTRQLHLIRVVEK